MKLLQIPFLLLANFVFGQDSKTVVVTPNGKTVPKGKVWYISEGMIIKVQVSRGSLVSGTLCNAQLLSQPGYISSLRNGSPLSFKAFGVTFTNLEKTPYSNEYTYQFRVSKIVSLENGKMVESEKGTFDPGDYIIVGECLQSIELMEADSVWFAKHSTFKKEDKAKTTSEYNHRLLKEPVLDLMGKSRIWISERTQTDSSDFKYVKDGYTFIEIKGKKEDSIEYSLGFNHFGICYKVDKMFITKNEETAYKAKDSLRTFLLLKGFKEKKREMAGIYKGYYETYYIKDNFEVEIIKGEVHNSENSFLYYYAKIEYCNTTIRDER